MEQRKKKVPVFLRQAIRQGIGVTVAVLLGYAIADTLGGLCLAHQHARSEKECSCSSHDGRTADKILTYFIEVSLIACNLHQGNMLTKARALVLCSIPFTSQKR